MCNRELENRAKAQIMNGESSCIVTLGDAELYNVVGSGILPLLSYANEAKKREVCVFDKVIGKAAAFLCLHLGANYVWANTMSRPAATLLEEHNVEVGYENLVDAILRKDKKGVCPMEAKMMTISNVLEAVEMINNWP